MFVKIFLITGLALLVWSAVARPSGAHGHKVTYRVQAYDTLWTIASAHYGGDVRGAGHPDARSGHLRRLVQTDHDKVTSFEPAVPPSHFRALRSPQSAPKARGRRTDAPCGGAG